MTAPAYFITNGSDPANWAVAVTPNDSTDLAMLPRSIYIGGAGSLVVNMPDGSSVTFVALNSGYILPVRAKRILATGTTCTNIVALY